MTDGSWNYFLGKGGSSVFRHFLNNWFFYSRQQRVKQANCKQITALNSCIFLSRRLSNVFARKSLFLALSLSVALRSCLTCFAVSLLTSCLSVDDVKQQSTGITSNCCLVIDWMLSLTQKQKCRRPGYVSRSQSTQLSASCTLMDLTRSFINLIQYYWDETAQ